ncbi:MAG: type II toxin-antitoxin system RatA family toxin [Magnetococcales bacterium]|nr:type II toxin-antitoxin system RatA family toxin [Magnetococcales bacterium]
MKSVATETVPFTPQQMYDLVVDMDSYPEFIPWCTAAGKYDETDTSFVAEMTVSFKAVRETFRTLDTVEPGKRITINLMSGPFKELKSEWRFSEVPRGCKIDFSIEFSFKNRLMDMTLGPVFGQATKKMVKAFRDRAKALYG